MRAAQSFLLLKCPLQLGRKGLAALKFISRFKPRQLLPICLVINFDSTNAKKKKLRIVRWFLFGPADSHLNFM